MKWRSAAWSSFEVRRNTVGHRDLADVVEAGCELGCIASIGITVEQPADEVSQIADPVAVLAGAFLFEVGGNASRPRISILELATSRSATTALARLPRL
jgi:hypothetical protein